ncbi:MAG TPA: cupin domain-containing protein [Polyangia bacterium]|nr:cupin domain-containing protein [Polyangia bacterium]
MSGTPNRPIRAGAHPFGEWGRGARFQMREVELGKLGGASQIGVNLVVVPPGKQSVPFHWHLREEEHFYVLDGRCVARVGDERFEMSAGDYICFPAGTQIAHAVENPFDAECRLLTIGPWDPHEVCGYPDSGKISVRGIKRMFRPGGEASLDYWDGEPIDEPLTKR